jgi:hypothetical protein
MGIASFAKYLKKKRGASKVIVAAGNKEKL